MRKTKDEITLWTFRVLEKYSFLAISIITAILLCFSCQGFAAKKPKNQVLDRAKPYLQFLSETINSFWNGAPLKHYIPAQIEQESLWRVKAALKTSREYGIGLSQVTIAYNKDGTERFNNFLNAKNKYKELKNWKWEDRYNPKYHMIFIVLEDRYLFGMNKRLFNNNKDRWAGSLVSYNAGHGTVQKRRALCKVTGGCNYELWFGGLDTVSMKFEKRILYGRTLAKMRNEYPHNVINVRSHKYMGLI